MSASDASNPTWESGTYTCQVTDPEADKICIFMACPDSPDMSPNAMFGLYITGSEPPAGVVFWAIKDANASASTNLTYQILNIGEMSRVCPRSLYLELGPVGHSIDHIDRCARRAALDQAHRDWIVTAVNSLYLDGLVAAPISRTMIDGMIEVAAQDAAWTQREAARSASLTRRQQQQEVCWGLAAAGTTISATAASGSANGGEWQYSSHTSVGNGARRRPNVRWVTRCSRPRTSPDGHPSTRGASDYDVRLHMERLDKSSGGPLSGLGMCLTGALERLWT
ncbi:hypothetical protein GGTG_04861 [Gaeumannomyces tritici R3-111a-1]|uniref:Uncharacterized protein n=1 Tax=Gaeumannomyces tritici (strain R3-111a-1) TaxID=644352 RepID=J3NUA7_GAET3|nr:hypothetical protein GGTG_04861 [Gaeumannomyces tritici R3-111a-1]EJT79778.1 hypothetical protein GGTG_04861 [Gaeumannomyces tritici R3-111a-1]